SAWEIFLWFFYFRRQKVRCLPSSVGEKHRHHSAAKRSQGPLAVNRTSRGHMFAGQYQSGNHQGRDGDDFHHHKRALCSSAGFYAETVDKRQTRERDGGDDP